jgi:hypothetical protein
VLQLAAQALDGAIPFGKLGAHGPQVRPGLRALVAKLGAGPRALALQLSGALRAHALNHRITFGAGMLELCTGSARMTHELLGEACHLPPRGALLAVADAQLTLELGQAPIGNGERLLDLYDRARAGDILAHEGPSVKASSPRGNRDNQVITTPPGPARAYLGRALSRARGKDGGSTHTRTRRRMSRTFSRGRWAEYRELLEIALEQGYAVLSLEAWLADPTLAAGRPHLLLRHDVDQHPASALRMAGIERELGVTSTWYFRWRTANLRVIETIAADGHAVGLHYETLTRELLRRGLGANEAEALIPQARELLHAELKSFAKRFGPARSACPHGDTRVPGVHNGALLLGEEWSRYGLHWDANAAMRGHPLDVWLTDRSAAEGRWKEGLDPIDLLIDRRSPILAVVHPNNWVSGPALWWDRALPGALHTGDDEPVLT